MFLVSGPALVKAACRARIIGSFPTANCRTVEELDRWLAEMQEDQNRAADETGAMPAPFCPNLIVHRSNPRLADDLAAVLRARAELVITSVGSPEPVVKPLKEAGCLVLADVASVRHAERAVAAGVDGLVLLTAGAGGQTGWANPFAFVRAVRAFWKGIVVMAGGMSDGHAIAAAETLGCDLAYMGTKFIATTESLAKDAYKTMLVNSRLDDVLLTRAFTGLETNMLRPSIVAAGLDPEHLPVRGAIDIAKDINAAERAKPEAKRWRDIWSAGHTVSGVADVPSVATLVERTAREYEAAKRPGSVQVI
ncbi:nitronate monooxygenase [Enhydrobacter aerosaccus]|uniref:Nitronate monooxygenase n=2 Tax=Enhydrobacter aerosaccus TaxID=225324 RepID=A0A1T4T0H0_9HYPH|nr:nitronate monooxygenase [Enhydrobacter aerosaccus]